MPSYAEVLRRAAGHFDDEERVALTGLAALIDRITPEMVEALHTIGFDSAAPTSITYQRIVDAHDLLIAIHRGPE